MYGVETWAVHEKVHEKLDVAEMRWICGLSWIVEKIRNERIRGMTKVGEISQKVQEKMGM